MIRHPRIYPQPPVSIRHPATRHKGMREKFNVGMKYLRRRPKFALLFVDAIEDWTNTHFQIKHATAGNLVPWDL